MSSPQDAVPFGPFEELLHAARTGDRVALGRLLEACSRPLLRLARRELNPGLLPKGGASDVVQETFLKALREIETFRGCTPAQLLAWLRVILLHTVFNFSRRFHTDKRQVAREAGGLRAPNDVRHAAPSASDAVIRHEQARVFEQALHRLPAHYVRVIQLRNGERRSFVEIGRLTGRSPEAARKVWLRAVAEMGRELAGGPSRGTALA